MIRDKENDIQKMMDCFEKLTLSQEQLATVESYLKGEISEEELDKVAFTDLSQYGEPESYAFTKVMDGFVRQKKSDEIKRFFNAQFAIGHATSCVFFRWYQWLEEEGKENIVLNGVDPGKICAVAAEAFTGDVYRAYQWVGKFADQAPRNLLKAIEYHRGQSNQCRILLLYCYFLMKYSKVDGEGGSDRVGCVRNESEHCPGSEECVHNKSDHFRDNAEFQGGGEFAAGNTASCGVEEEDRVWLRYYEDMLLDCLEELFEGIVDRMAVAQMKEEIRSGRIDEARSRLPVGIQLSLRQKHLLPLAGGCAYANFRLSGVLKQIVELCLIADTEQMLCVMSAMDTNGEMACRGGDFDRIFGVSPVKLMLWAADKEEKTILQMRFQRDREGYMELLEEAGYVRSIVMRSVVRENEIALYEAFLEGHREVYRENIISMLVDDNGAVEQQARAYLEGKEPIRVLCAVSDKIKEKHFLASLEEMETVEDYHWLYGDEAFYRRCEAYLFLLRGTSWQFFDGKIRRRGRLYFPDRRMYESSRFCAEEAESEHERIQQIFRDCSLENMTLACQLDGAVMIVEHDRMSRKEKFFHKVKDVFAGYLKEDRKGMAEAFRCACVEGRYLGLMTYETDAETYREEIMGYAKDTAKTIKEKLAEILCTHTEWEEDIRKLQNSSRKAERMLADRVLQNWGKAAGKFK